MFEDWWYLRFLLPSYPLLIVLASAALLIVLQRTPAPRSFAAALLALLVAHGIYFCLNKDVFNIAVGEARYQRVGEFAGARTARPLAASQHAAQRQPALLLAPADASIRSIGPDRLDEVVAHFQARGCNVFIVLDEWEKREFRGRFARDSALGRLDWAPWAVAPGRAWEHAGRDLRSARSDVDEQRAPRIIP